MAIRFTIDHYEPRSARPDLENNYSNLMWACDECNTRKGSRSPPESARSEGLRYFRPDEDYREEHFERTGLRLKGLTQPGDFTIEAVDLNRANLRRLREMRVRIGECDEAVSGGIMALINFPIDRLPPEIRSKVANMAKRFSDAQAEQAQSIDDILRERAHSPFLDEVDDAAEQNQRKARLREYEALYPDAWRRTRKESL
ncbi:HNH endonuclease [Rhizobium sp. WYJ-E13]|uniref:HNH endonuclease n=1 Tax=Rhizobium sp. WYJ-E13 TaxID=2849093 RepID=UPI001C1EF9A6|nr:HNH endonuclease [Rhizobium sp. WYJ-E13]QWW67956.1 HNH endonuclease [Rhizobium sp. WYJ-E13]